MERFVTSCPVNCYSTCSMIVVVENDCIVGLETDPANKVTSVSLCLKGLSQIERVYSKKRITTPLLKKKKPDGTSDFQPVSWEKAIGIICDQLLFHKEKYGPQSIFYYTASGQKGLLNEVGMNFFKLFGGCSTKYGDLCWQAGLEATRLTLGANKHNAPWDLENSDLVILWGKNPAETNIQQMQFIYAALDNGARLIVIDPRRTQSCERAESVLQLKPGTDGALALGIANELIRQNAVDNDFINHHVLGFEQFKTYAEQFTLEKTSRITGLPQKYIVYLAESIAAAKAMTICCGFGLQRFTNSGQAVRAIIALSVISGNIGRPGAGWSYANLQSAVFDAVPAPISAYPNDGSSDIRYAVSTARLGADMLQTHSPPLKMAWISRGNPVSQNPDTHQTLKAFEKLNFIVAIELFMTDTAKAADLVLPAASMFEQTDIATGYWHPYIQLRQKIIEPVGLAKPESEIFYLIARNLGFNEDEFTLKIPEPDDLQIRKFLENKLSSFSDLTFDTLKKGAVPAPGYEEVAFSDLKFPTPSGKIELASQTAAEKWGVSTLPEYVPPKESLPSAEKEEQPFLFYLLTPNTKNRIHSQFNNMSAIRQFSPYPDAQIHPEDAEQMKVSDGDMINIFNKRGSIQVKARLDFAIRTGCVCVCNGWWISEGGGVNLCSKGRETDMGYGAAFHDNLVQIERI